MTGVARRREHRGAGGDGRVGHAAAGAAGVRRPARRPPAHPRPGPGDAGDRPAPAVRWAAPSSGARGPPRSPRPPSCWPWRRPRWGCAWASRTRATTASGSTTRQAYDLVSEGFGPGANGPLLVAADLRRARRRGRPARAGAAARGRGRRGVRRPARGSTPPATRRSSPSIPTTAPQAAATRSSCDRLRDDVCRPRRPTTSAPCRRDHGGVRRPERAGGRAPAAVHRRRGGPVVPAAAAWPSGRR